MSNNWVFVDDRDPGIAYEPPGAGVWHGGVLQEYNQTTTGLGSGDTAIYYFNASAIGVFGTYRPTGDSGSPVTVYQVDDGPAITVTAPTTQTTLYHQALWTSSQLPSLASGASHKLVVTRTATAPNDILWLDYLAYPSDQDSTTTTSSTTSPLTTSRHAVRSTPTESTVSTSPSSGLLASTPSTNAAVSTTSTIGAIMAIFSSSPTGTSITTASLPTPTPGDQSSSGTTEAPKKNKAISAGIVIGIAVLLLLVFTFYFTVRPHLQ